MKSVSGPDENSLMLVVITNVEEDDVSAIIDSLEFEKNMLFLTDSVAVRNISVNLSKDIVYLLDDFRDLSSTIKNLKGMIAGKSIVGVIGLDEEYGYSISKRMAEEFSLKFYPKDVLECASNKRLQKDVFSRFNIRIPHYFIFDIHKDVSDAQLNKIGFPNILKPVRGYASFNVYKSNDVSDFRKNVMNARQNLEPTDLSESNLFMIEEYILGTEYSCDFIVGGVGRGVNVLRVTKKISGAAIGEFEGFILFNPDFMKDAEFKLEPLKHECDKIAAAYGFSEGVYMVDFMYANGEIVILESTVRPGVATFIELMSQLYNYTSVNVLIRQRFGLPFHIDMPTKSGSVIYLRSSDLGLIENFEMEGLEHGRFGDKILSTYKIFDKGSVLTDYDYPTSRTNILGYVFFRDIKFNDIDSLRQYVAEGVSIKIRPLK
ncbi:MAG: ATP-grasp domain-containing protein [Candidatus Woesearchaeota archaeon]